jgi:hypothetical protein
LQSQELAALAPRQKGKGPGARSMTLQKIFDTVAQALMAQGRPSVIDGNGRINCVYAAADGARCAVGHLMNEDELNTYGNFDGDIFALLNRCNSWGMRPLFREYAAFLRELQHPHDTPSGGDDWLDCWKQLMRDVARIHSLSDAVLDNAV